MYVVNEIFTAMETKELLEAFELTNDNNDTNIPTVRGWIMDELELRNPVEFANWLDTDDMNKIDHPSLFFGI